MSAAERRVLTGRDANQGPLTHKGRQIPPGGCLAEGNRAAQNDSGGPQGPQSGAGGLI